MENCKTVYYITFNPYHKEYDAVHFGSILEQDKNCESYVYVSKYAVNKHTKINNIPIKDFNFGKEIYPLPKDWTYKTKLYDITYDYDIQLLKNIKINDKNAISKLIKDSVLIKKSEDFTAYHDIDVDINSHDKTYKIVSQEKKNADCSEEKVRVENIFDTYKEAQNKLQEKRNEANYYFGKCNTCKYNNANFQLTCKDCLNSVNGYCKDIYDSLGVKYSCHKDYICYKFNPSEIAKRNGYTTYDNYISYLANCCYGGKECLNIFNKQSKTTLDKRLNESIITFFPINDKFSISIECTPKELMNLSFANNNTLNVKQIRKFIKYKTRPIYSIQTINKVLNKQEILKLGIE